MQVQVCILIHLLLRTFNVLIFPQGGGRGIIIPGLVDECWEYVRFEPIRKRTDKVRTLT